MYRTLLAAGALPLILNACSDTRASAAPAAAAKATPVEVVAALSRDVRPTEEFSGRIEATETVDVRPRVAGTIERVHFRDGQEVASGALLFTIDPRPFRAELARAEAQLSLARTQAALAATELRRTEPLVDLKAASQQELDQMIAAQRGTVASVAAAEAAVDTARLNLGYTEVRAPIAGRVSRANVTAGNFVAVGERVLTSLVSQDRVYAYFDASEAFYLRTLAPRNGKRPAVSIDIALAGESEFKYRGDIDFVDNRLNPVTGAIRVRAVLDNRERVFTPGLFARVRVADSAAQRSVLIPDVAVGTQQTKRFVLVVDNDQRVAWREIVPGPVVNGERIVARGLDAGERVIVGGLHRVRPGDTVAASNSQAEARVTP